MAPLKAAAEPWHWPTPPFAGYQAGAADSDTACAIEGLTSAAIGAVLLALDFDGARLRIRVNVTGTELTLRFAQRKRLAKAS